MEFGECLAIILPKLKEIEENHPDNNSNAFRDVVHEWQVTKTTRPFTWDTLRLVLKVVYHSDFTDLKLIHIDLNLKGIGKSF